MYVNSLRIRKKLKSNEDVRNAILQVFMSCQIAEENYLGHRSIDSHHPGNFKEIKRQPKRHLFLFVNIYCNDYMHFLEKYRQLSLVPSTRPYFTQYRVYETCKHSILSIIITTIL